jgi:hypothetical protein
VSIDIEHHRIALGAGAVVALQASDLGDLARRTRLVA